MKMEYIDGLLHSSITINYQGKQKNIDHVIVDTGAARTIISADEVFNPGSFCNSQR